MKIERKKTMSEKQILASTAHFYSVGAIIGDAGAMTVNNRKVIKAGTPVGGATSILTDEQTILNKVSDDTVQGVVLHDVDVTDGQGNGTLLLWGFVNEYRLDSDVTIPEAVKTALDGKITFLKRNK